MVGLFGFILFRMQWLPRPRCLFFSPNLGSFQLVFLQIIFLPLIFPFFSRQDSSNYRCYFAWWCFKIPLKYLHFLVFLLFCYCVRMRSIVYTPVSWFILLPHPGCYWTSLTYFLVKLWLLFGTFNIFCLPLDWSS